MAIRNQDNKNGITIVLTPFYLYLGLIGLLGYFIVIFSVINQSDPLLTSSTGTTGSSNVIHELAKAHNEIEKLTTRASKSEQYAANLLKLKESADKKLLFEHQMSSISKTKTNVEYTQGVIILGMHRSGTSLLGGLMNAMGLNTGSPLIPPASDNSKGFFERIDVVLQNDYIMKKQNVHYAGNMHLYDHKKGLKDIYSEPDGSKFFNEGRRGLAFLNNPKNYPWMLKDPRLCITLRTWLPLLEYIPTVVFQYRNPLDVALSLQKREIEHFKIARTLKMWYVYNRLAITQSHDLCRVITSHHAVMKNTKTELDRIYNELNSCGLQVPHEVSNSKVAEFVDSSLQHGRTQKEDVCAQDLSTILPPQNAWQTTEELHIKLYRDCLVLFCSMEDRSAFKRDFKFKLDIFI